jgi:hypothetical protein
MASAVNALNQPTILSSYAQGQEGDVAGLKSAINSSMSPIQAFACLASYFAGQEETKMATKLKEYEKAFNDYKECLEHSKEAHEGKAGAAAKDGCVSSKDIEGFDTYMDKITNNAYSDKMDKKDDSNHNKDEWQSFADVLNEQKDLLSTDLNKISTEMDMAVKDSSEAEQMAANAIKKAVELMSTQGKTSGG